MKTPKTVKKIDSNIWKRKKTWIVIGTIVLVVVTLITIASLTMYYTTIPKAPKSDAIPISTPKKYFASVYQSLEGGKDISSVVKTTDINWLWDSDDRQVPSSQKPFVFVASSKGYEVQDD
jgi:hypothetical protein